MTLTQQKITKKQYLGSELFSKTFSLGVFSRVKANKRNHFRLAWAKPHVSMFFNFATSSVALRTKLECARTVLDTSFSSGVTFLSFLWLAVYLMSIFFPRHSTLSTKFTVSMQAAIQFNDQPKSPSVLRSPVSLIP